MKVHLGSHSDSLFLTHIQLPPDPEKPQKEQQETDHVIKTKDKKEKKKYVSKKKEIEAYYNKLDQKEPKKRPQTSRACMNEPEITASELLDDNSVLVFCKLCKCAFQPFQIKKIVTMKMLSVLRSHYNKRGIFKFDHFTKFKDTKRTCKVCDLCYQIIIAEHDLIHTTERFAKLQGIPIEDPNNEKKVVKDKNYITSDIFKCKLKQWRLMFYFDVMRDFPLKDLLKKQKLKNGLYLQMRLANYITKFPLNYKDLIETSKPKNSLMTPMRRMMASHRKRLSSTKNVLKSKFVDDALKHYKVNKSREIKFKTRSDSFEAEISKPCQEIPRKHVNLNCNKLRIHYFFTEDYTIDSFINNTVVDLRLTDGESWKEVIAEGKITLGSVDKVVNSTIHNIVYKQSHKGENLDEIIRMENVNAYMFFKNNQLDPYYMKVKVSYKFDQEIQTEKLDLWKYNGIFLPKNSYFNSNALPIEWLEMFERKETLVELEEKETEAIMSSFIKRQKAGCPIDPVSFLNRINLKPKRPKSSYNGFSFKKPCGPVQSGVLGSFTYLDSKKDLKPTDSEATKDKKRCKKGKSPKILTLKSRLRTLSEIEKSVEIANEKKGSPLKNKKILKSPKKKRKARNTSSQMMTKQRKFPLVPLLGRSKSQVSIEPLEDDPQALTAKNGENDDCDHTLPTKRNRTKTRENLIKQRIKSARRDPFGDNKGIDLRIKVKSARNNQSSKRRPKTARMIAHRPGNKYTKKINQFTGKVNIMAVKVPFKSSKQTRKAIDIDDFNVDAEMDEIEKNIQNREHSSIFEFSSRPYDQEITLTKRGKRFSETQTTDKSASYFSKRRNQPKKEKPVKDLFFSHKSVFKKGKSLKDLKKMI
ncbi:unnamed protein product [Moneuplotes crassus]|uniref:Uncharacterized protein n=1 Tax=Euplotes crassus TaxID=5936 RepID=A0AAD1XJN0_EUPCR|nr:unnamed protein product [Moneuplotes crassus]